jgi:hypothetical protein
MLDLFVLNAAQLSHYVDKIMVAIRVMLPKLFFNRYDEHKFTLAAKLTKWASLYAGPNERAVSLVGCFCEFSFKISLFASKYNSVIDS